MKLSVKTPKDLLNANATKDMSLFMIPKAVFNAVKVSLKFLFEYCFTDWGLGSLISIPPAPPALLFSHTLGCLLPVISYTNMKQDQIFK